VTRASGRKKRTASVSVDADSLREDEADMGSPALSDGSGATPGGRGKSATGKAVRRSARAKK